ncbi:hypothetical protein HN481_02295 [Candidatus Parcubacteria bacterium]|jgi:HTH-type transcriptional regulator, sugar sensing transcriptional regulator|nr:hypothetical protein [Candidatus Parcubacteria bacterium]
MKFEHNTLVSCGLAPHEATIYLILNKQGELDVPSIVKITNMSRTTVYEALSSLLSRKFITYRKQGKIALYGPEHPSKLAPLVDEKRNETERASHDLQNTLKSLTPQYNLTKHKPGVRFFEGEEGINEALEDTFICSKPTYSIVDIEASVKHLPQINKRYRLMCEQRKLEKKMLVYNTPNAKKLALKEKSKLLGIRILNQSIKPAYTSMHIYDNKVGYLTLRKDDMMGIIIDDPHIYQTQLSMFEYLWSVSKEI